MVHQETTITNDRLTVSAVLLPQAEKVTKQIVTLKTSFIVIVVLKKH